MRSDVAAWTGNFIEIGNGIDPTENVVVRDNTFDGESSNNVAIKTHPSVNGYIEMNNRFINAVIEN